MLRPLSQLTCLYVFVFFILSSGSPIGVLSFGQEETYSVPPEAEKQEGVPEGVVHGPLDFGSRIYPGTNRQYWLYVPAQYSADKPACSLIVQDGLSRAQGWRLPQILDNLIHANEMPVTIGIFIAPGVVPASAPWTVCPMP